MFGRKKEEYHEPTSQEKLKEYQQQRNKRIPEVTAGDVFKALITTPREAIKKEIKRLFQ